MILFRVKNDFIWGKKHSIWDTKFVLKKIQFGVPKISYPFFSNDCYLKLIISSNDMSEKRPGWVKSQKCHGYSSVTRTEK